MANLNESLDECELNIEIEDNEKVELLKSLEVARYNKFESGINYHYKLNSHLIYYDTNKELIPSVLNNTLIIKSLNSIKDLNYNLRNLKGYMQSLASNLKGNERQELQKIASINGIYRLTNIGEITEGVLGTPHEGEFALKELTHVIVDEGLDSNNIENGYVYGTGGTTGEPRYREYSYGEFTYIAQKLASSYTDLCLLDTCKVANLFMAGNLWSSFNIIQKALEVLGVKQLPLGANLELSTLNYFMQKHNPNVIFGIPSIIAQYAKFLLENNESLTLEYIYFAGEKITNSQKDLFARVFNNPQIISAGYASVDAGLIGYQDIDCNEEEFKLFHDVGFTTSDQGELLVKPFGFKQFLHTGDRVVFDGQKFCLKGRIDKLIFIWGARIGLELLVSKFPDYQFEIKNGDDEEVIVFKTDTSDEYFEKSISEFYHASFDLKQTLSLEVFCSRVKWEKCEKTLSQRTGKSLILRDLRTSKD